MAFSQRVTRFINRVTTTLKSVARGRFLFVKNGSDIITPDTAMKVSGFYRGVIYISSQISKLPFYVKDRKNEILLNDTVSKLIGVAPNSEMSAMDFWSLALQTAIPKGDFFAEIERDSLGRPTNLWPIEFERVTPERDPKGRLYYRVTNFGQPDSLFSPMDMFHIKNMHLTPDGLRGQGLVAYAVNVLGISMGADSMANSLFKNNGMPSGVLEVPNALSDEAFDRLKTSWKSQNSGENKASIAVLEEGVKYNPISHAPDNLQFLESRKFSVLEISRFLGLHPTKLFDIDGAKFANMENANLETVTDCLDTWARRIEKEVNIKLLNYNYNGRKSEIDTFELTRGDMATRSEYYTKRLNAGSITPNQIREFEGEAPYTGGDKYYIAANNLTPVDRVDEVIDAQVRDKSKPDKSNGSLTQDSVKAALEILAEFVKDK